MMPTVANKSVTLSSGKAKVNFGFKPDYVAILNVTNIGASSADKMVLAKGKPDYGGSDGKMVALATVADTDGDISLVNSDLGNNVSHFAGKAVSGDDFLGLDIDLSGVSTVGNSDELLITGYRTNS